MKDINWPAAIVIALVIGTVICVKLQRIFGKKEGEW